jgi:hypothetical protein
VVPFGNIPTQSVADEMNDKILAYQLRIQNDVTTQVSYGNSSHGHLDLDRAARLGVRCCATPWRPNSDMCFCCGSFPAGV